MLSRWLLFENQSKFSSGLSFSGSRTEKWSFEKAVENGHISMLEHLQFPAYNAPLSLGVELASRNGHLATIKWIEGKLACRGCSWYDLRLKCTALDQACLGGHLEVVEFLHYKGSPCTSSAFDNASASGNLDLLVWLHENRSEGCTLAAMDGAAENGHMHVMEWLAQNRTEGCSERALVGTSGNGDLHMVEWVCANYPPDEGQLLRSLSSAASYGHLHVVQFLLETCPDIHDSRLASRCLSLEAAKGGQLNVLRWLLVNDLLSQDAELMDGAAGASHLHVLKFLHSLNYPSTRCAMDMAAMEGGLSIVEFLHFNRHEGCTKHAMNLAAMGGHLKVVEFLHQNRREGCTQNAMDLASKNGHLETVKWLHENRVEGCTKKAMNHAAGSGHIDVVQWLSRNRSEGAGFEAMDQAATNGHLDVVEWLHVFRSEGPTNLALDGAAANGHLNVVEWLHHHRGEGGTLAALTSAAAHNHLPVVEFLHRNRAEGTTFRAVDEAAARGHLAMVQWLCAHRPEGCTRAAADGAAAGGHLAVLEWLLLGGEGGGGGGPGEAPGGRGGPRRGPPAGLRCSAQGVARAAERGHLGVVEFLLGAPGRGKKLIILDEPFVGLDPATAVSVARELVHVRQVYGTAFLLISHVKEYVELLRPDHTITLETAPPAPPPRHPLASWLGPSFWGRTALTVGDYLFLSFPLIFLAFAAAGLAVGMLFADVLGRTEVLDRIMGVFDSEFKGVQIPGQSEVASKLMLAMLRAKITQVINRYVPEVKEQLYAQGLAKLFALELGPLLTALLLAGRIGGAYSGTVGTLQATQQNHLLQNLGISPRIWTLGPAAIAAVIAAPILTLVGTTVALSAGGFVAQWYHLSGNEVYWDKVQTSLVDFDQGSFNWKVFPPIVLLYRSWGFIAIILLVSEILSRWRKNLQPRNVSFVITSSVVCSSLLIIIADWGFSQLLVRSSA